MTLQFLRLTFIAGVVVMVGASPVIAGPAPAKARPAPAIAVPTGGLNDFTVTTWDETDGLSAGVITAIAQDLDGYLYIGTDVGLVRFDGVRFQPMGGAIGKTRPPFESVTALLSARDGSLWIGVGGGYGIVRLHQGTNTKYSANEGFQGLANSLLEDRQATIWAATSLGLRRFSGNKWVPDGGEVGLDTLPTLAMHEDRQGRFWVATREKVFRRDRAGAPFTRVDDIAVSSRIWQGFAEDVTGTVWITDFFTGLRRVGEPPDPKPRHSGRGVRLLHDRRGNLWAATRGQGLWRLRSASDRHAVPDVITAKDGLANDAVQSVFEDREGNIWVGTNAGLQRLTPHQLTPLTDLPIARAIASTPDGTVWVGTTVGLVALSPTGRQQYQEAQGFPGVVVLGLAADPRGAVWVASERALARFANGKFTKILDVESDKRLFSIAFSDGSVWLRDVNFDLRRITETGKDIPLDDVPRDFHERVFTLVTDRDGRLWIGTTKGLVGLRSPGGSFRVLDPGVGTISVIYQDSAGAMWFGGEDGFSRFADERFTAVTRTNGLRSSVSAIIEDESGVMWLGLRSGIARIANEQIAQAVSSPKHPLRFRLFNSAEGAAGIPVAGGSRTVVRSQDGRLWFATSGGVTVVDPDAIAAEEPLPVPVKLESVTTQNRPFEPTQNLRLPSRASHVQFAFTALTLTDSMRVHFRYKLDGQDQDWVEAGTNRQVSYTNLPPGSYQFLLSASNGDAFDDPEILTFSVAPTFYQTRWFYALCALGIASALYGSWRLNARRVRGQFALVLAERIRMSRAIHDTLLQGLAGLALQLDDLSHGFDTPSTTLKERVQSMRKRVEDYIREARQSIWDLRHPAVESRPFPEALRDAGLRAINGAPIAFEFATAGTPRACSPAVREQLLHICQEAVTNAVRHGHPGRVGVELEYTDKAVRVRVDDDGKGFDPASVAGGRDGHYGVISMKERAAQVRGRLTIASSPGRGTRVETIVPPM